MSAQRPRISIPPGANVTFLEVVSAELDARSIDALCNQLLAFFNECSTDVVVDMAGMQTISTSLAATLLFGSAKAKESGRSLRIINASERLRSAFEVLRVDRILETTDPASRAGDPKERAGSPRDYRGIDVPSLINVVG